MRTTPAITVILVAVTVLACSCAQRATVARVDLDRVITSALPANSSRVDHQQDRWHHRYVRTSRVYSVPTNDDPDAAMLAATRAVIDAISAIEDFPQRDQRLRPGVSLTATLQDSTHCVIVDGFVMHGMDPRGPFDSVRIDVAEITR